MKHFKISLVSIFIFVSVCFTKGNPAGDDFGTSVEVSAYEKMPRYKGISQLATAVRPGWKIGSHFSASSYGKTSTGDKERIFEIFKANYNILNAGIYMPQLMREKGIMKFDQTDEIVDFAQKNNIDVYFHPLIGGVQYTAPWVNNSNFTKEELQVIMRDWIKSVLTRYKGKVKYVDVVNEALSGMQPDGVQFKWKSGWKEDRSDKNVWLETMGMYQGKKIVFPNYFVDAFRIAREFGGSDCKLIYNEWGNATTKSSKGLAVFNLIKAMKEEGIPVDGVGIQLHCAIKDGKFFEDPGSVKQQPFDFEAFDKMLGMYQQAGIDVHITEFDIHLSKDPAEADFELQGRMYAEIVKHAIQSPAVKTFKSWGVCDKYSWQPKQYNAKPLIWDENFIPKPAYKSQVEMLTLMLKAKNKSF
jgi:endo-1,4-beta-xylanase